MSENGKPRFGPSGRLPDSPPPSRLGFLSGKPRRLKNNPIPAAWRPKNKGAVETFRLTVSRMLRMCGILGRKAISISVPPDKEALNLRRGEWVEVKAEQEIRRTLNENQRYKELYFGGGMREFCGKRYRVHKRIKLILLQGDLERRTAKNAVLLEGVTCEAQARFGCDRPCSYYWTDAWLRRVE